MGCNFPDCEKKHYAKGYCHTHYSRVWRNGDLELRRAADGEPLKWLHDVAMKLESDNCLLYPFGVGSHGYGAIHNENGVMTTSNRYICTAAHGDPPADEEAAHSCGVKLCVNKRHLRWDTHAGNLADMVSHGTKPQGMTHGQVKLTEANVLAIRAAEGNQSKIGETFGVCQQTVSDIKNKRRWAWL